VYVLKEIIKTVSMNIAFTHAAVHPRAVFPDSTERNNPRLVLAYEPPAVAGTLTRLCVPESMTHTHDLPELLDKVERRAVELRRRGGLDTKSPTLELVAVVTTALDANALINFASICRHYNVLLTAVVVVVPDQYPERVCGIVLGQNARAQGLVKKISICLPPFPDTRRFIRTLEKCVPRRLPHDIVARAGGTGPGVRVIAFDMKNGRANVVAYK